MPTKSIKFGQFEGLNNVLPAHELGLKFLQEAKNVDIDDKGKIRRMKGNSSVFSGDVHSIDSNNDICLFREGAALKRFWSDYSTTTLRTGLTTAKIPMAYLFLNSLVYYSDGMATGIIQDGIGSRSWGLSVPLAPQLSATWGHMSAGRYQVSLTYVRDDGQESGTDVAVYIDLSSESGITIQLPQSSDSSVEYINVYISSANGDVLYLAQTLTHGTLEAIYRGDTTEFNLPLNTQLLQPAIAGNVIEYYNGRVYIAQDNVLWYSEPYAYELFNIAENFIQFDKNITLLGAVGDGMFLTTEEETVFLSGDNPPFRKTRKAGYGAYPGKVVKADASKVGRGTIDGIALFWESVKGKCVGFNEGIFKNLTENKYSYVHGRRNAGIFRQAQGMNQYISVLQDTTGVANNKYS